MQLTKKTFHFLLIMLLIFSLNAPFVSAFDLSSLAGLLEGTGNASADSDFGQASVLALGPSISSQVSGALSSIGLNKQAVKTVSKQFNAMDYKNTGPQVELTFVPVTPSPGKKITAVANPTNFTNNPKNLYFTWFLKKASCVGNRACDYNKDGETDIEDYKIEAARLIASGDFDWQTTLGKDDPNCQSSNPPEHCTLENQYDALGGSTADSDEHEAVTGGTDQAGKATHCIIPRLYKNINESNINCSLDSEMEKCEHIFPKTTPALDQKVGDGEFDPKEEAFWRTNPRANDTAGKGEMDEAVVAGLGQMELSWIYSPGDQVGVAIEGVSGPTTAKDASYRTMWAITNNPDVMQFRVDRYHMTCPDSDTRGWNSNFAPPFSSDDINLALTSAFVEPTTGTDYKKISNNLSSSHSSPQYDASSTGGNSDAVTLRSNTTNADDKNFTNYKWELDVADSADAAVWKSLTQTDLGGAVPLEGMGLDELKVPLSSIKKEALTAAGVADDATTFYVRATLKTKTTAAGGVKKEGLETMIIPVQSSKGEMGAASGLILSDKLLEGIPKCNGKAEKSVCPVTPNEIVAVNIPTDQYDPAKYSFSWTLDGARLAPEEGTPNLAFFPVTEGVGKVYTAKVDIAGLDSEEKVSFVRSFAVAEPETTIKSMDKDSLSPVLLGHYVDEDKGQQWADYSQDLFQAVAGSTVQLQARSNTSLAGTTAWLVDGKEISSANTSFTEPYLGDNGKMLYLPVVKIIGASYKVTSTTSYAQDDAREKVLYDRWGISSASLNNKNIAKTITIKVADNLNGEKKVTSVGQPKILASLFSGLPSYIAFLFKIIVTFALILLASGLVFRLSPERREK